MLRRRRTRARRAKSLSRQRRLTVEQLEERRLLAIMTVTNLDDDTLANLDGDMQLSLREAIEAINTGMIVDGIAPTSGVFGVNDEIQFAASLFSSGPQTITLADAANDLDITRAVVITGPGRGLLLQLVAPFEIRRAEILQLRHQLVGRVLRGVELLAQRVRRQRSVADVGERRDRRAPGDEARAHRLRPRGGRGIPSVAVVVSDRCHDDRDHDDGDGDHDDGDDPVAAHARSLERKCTR